MALRKVLFFTHSPVLGGAEISMLDIMVRLGRGRFRPHLLVPEPGPVSDRAHGLGIPVHFVNMHPEMLSWRRHGETARGGVPGKAAFHSLAAANALAGFLRSKGFAVIYTHSQKAHIIGGLAGKLAGAKVVWHCREMLEQPGLRRTSALLAGILPDRIICVSRATASQYSSGRAGKRLAVIPNGIDIGGIRKEAAKVPRSEVRRSLGVPAGAPLAGMVSRIAPGKGQHLFIDAAEIVMRIIPGARYLIVGGPLFGEERYLSDLKNGIGRRGLREQVTFAGHRERVYPIMAALDVMVHCPVTPEGFGRSVAEAMALGVPVAAARGGALPEIIEDGVDGLLTEPGNVNELAASIAKLLSDGKLRERIKGAGLEKAERHYDVSSTVSLIEKILES